MAYDHQAIEPTWQKRWENDGLYRSQVDWDKPKHYAVTMLPYPSGDLHIGHWYAMTPSDARARLHAHEGPQRLCSPSASTLLVCPPRMPPFSAGSIPPSGPGRISNGCAASYAPWAPCSTGIARWSAANPTTTCGPNTSSRRCTKRASRTGARPWSIGPRLSTPCWPTSR